ncbi:hypothetical protein [Paraburkholderia tropica]|uniref:hypothetical protein n=1 Tax=Paraburkholderia tropica TaxID=92647 RepID=UPI001F24BDD9|nr:hypothetical protein [Paraburkholderia tropica]
MRVQGRVKLLGNGRTDKYGWTIRSVAEIGDREIRGLRYSPRLGSYLNPGETVALGVQRVLGSPTVYAVATSDGRVRRGGVSGMLFLLFVYAIAMAACGFQVVNHGSNYYGLAIVALGWLATGPLKALRLCLSFDPLRT